MGNEGTIEVLNRQVLNFYPETFRGKAPAKIAARKEVHIELPGNDNKAVEAHMRNLIEAVQGKAKVIADPIIGQQAAISGHMATLSFRNNKKIIWDDKTRKVPLRLDSRPPVTSKRRTPQRRRTSDKILSMLITRRNPRDLRLRHDRRHAGHHPARHVEAIQTHTQAERQHRDGAGDRPDDRRLLRRPAHRYRRARSSACCSASG